MLKSLFRRTARQGTIAALYGMIVAQARSPSFYRHFGVADTVNGRFELVLVHLWLLLRRLGSEKGEVERALSQDLIDRFCTDMDGDLRELGTGDLKVPKEMRRIGEAFYGRAQAYDAALLNSGDQPLIDALTRNVGLPPAGAPRLAAYIRQAASELVSQSGEDFCSGRVRFPDPDAFAAR